MTTTLTSPPAVTLAERALRLEQYVEELLIDTDGVVLASIDDRTNKPWAPGDIKPTDDFLEVPGFEPWEVMNYENSGMTTGAYLAALSYQYLVTGESEVLSRAERTFRGLVHIYNIGRQQEEGFFPKTYGGRISHEISTDQYLYAIWGLIAYKDIAPEADVPAIVHMVTSMVDFWIKRDYKYDYFAFKDMLWPMGRFPPLLLAAYSLSGEERYREEAERINCECKPYLNPTDGQILARAEAENGAGENYQGCWIPECSAMDIMGLAECLKHPTLHQRDYLRCMALSWREGKLAVAENGLAYAWINYNAATGEAVPPEPHLTGMDDPLGWSFLQWRSGFMTPRSVMLARVGLDVLKWLPEENAAETVLHILQSVSEADMRHQIDPDGEQILEQHRFMSHWVDVDAITNWLWAYWQGRLEGVIPAQFLEE